MSNKAYINKILDDKVPPSNPQYIHPFPMDPDPAYNRRIKESISLIDKERNIFAREYGLSYCQYIGELIYTTIAYKPGVSIPLIKLTNIVLR